MYAIKQKYSEEAAKICKSKVYKKYKDMDSKDLQFLENIRTVRN